MDMIWAASVVGWIICGSLAFAILVRDTKLSFGRVRRGDAAFLSLYFLLGPLGLIIAILVWAADIGGNSKFWSKDIW